MMKQHIDFICKHAPEGPIHGLVSDHLMSREATGHFSLT